MRDPDEALQHGRDRKMNEEILGDFGAVAQQALQMSPQRRLLQTGAEAALELLEIPQQPAHARPCALIEHRRVPSNWQLAQRVLSVANFSLCVYLGARCGRAAAATQCSASRTAAPFRR